MASKEWRGEIRERRVESVHSFVFDVGGLLDKEPLFFSLRVDSHGTAAKEKESVLVVSPCMI